MTTWQDPEYLEPVLDWIAAGELRHTIEKEFLRAPKKQREVLYLTYYADMGATEIANHLRVPVITVRKRLEVAISQLRRHLDAATPAMTATSVSGSFIHR
jgi:DNA-directed RNA polymerase specialized sigma24 family protein